MAKKKYKEFPWVKTYAYPKEKKKFLFLLISLKQWKLEFASFLLLFVFLNHKCL